jgi:hypothetical protein
LHPDAAKLLEGSRAYAQKLGIVDRSWLESSGNCLVFPWTGTKGLEALKLCAELDGVEFEARSLSINYKTDGEALRLHLGRVSERAFDPVALAAALKESHRDKFDHLVPEDLLDLSNSRRSISLEDAVDAALEILGR